MFVSVCVNTSRSSWSLRLVLSFSSFLSCISHSFHPVSFSALLFPSTARRPRIRLPIVGPAVSPLPYLLKMLPLLVSWADSRDQRRGSLPQSSNCLIPLVTAGILSCPNLLTNLVNSAQVRVIHQLHEVPIPKLLIGHRGPTSTAGF